MKTLALVLGSICCLGCAAVSGRDLRCKTCARNCARYPRKLRFLAEGAVDVKGLAFVFNMGVGSNPSLSSKFCNFLVLTVRDSLETAS